MRIAVIGAGITGLAARWLLGQRHEVTLFEALGRAGGHSNTIEAPVADGHVAVDTGFIVYNPPAYPNLVALFDHLGVETAASNMSFAVSLDGGAYEYSGTGLTGYFGQRRNLLSPAHWAMAAEILRFHREAAQLAEGAGGGRSLAVGAEAEETLGAWLLARSYSERFVQRHILPMAAAIWSAPADRMLAYPARSFAKFFANHRLLQASGHPVWRTVKGGSRVYVGKLLAAAPGEVRLGQPVVRLVREAAGVVVVTADGGRAVFDRVAVCCHADDALTLLGDPDEAERSVLSAFGYTSNEAVLHRDRMLMPRRRRVWSSWNYVAPDPKAPVTVTYWMNSLQPLATGIDHFVTLNPTQPIAEAARVGAFHYRHPVFDPAAIAAQARLWHIQGRRRVWFGGAYCGSGFHEDGLQAGLAIAEHMCADDAPVRRPWRVADENGRLALPHGGLVSLQTALGAA